MANTDDWHDWEHHVQVTLYCVGRVNDLIDGGILSGHRYKMSAKGRGIYEEMLKEGFGKYVSNEKIASLVLAFQEEVADYGTTVPVDAKCFDLKTLGASLN